jgi:predicted AAA+ superfamily ATPase
MIESSFRLAYAECRRILAERLAEPPPGRIQLLTGPRQVGKTTLLLELAGRVRAQAMYVAADGPEAALPGFWERLWTRAEKKAAELGRVVVLLDEAQVLHDWAARLKAFVDRVRRRRIPIHVVATGSSVLRLAAGSRESLAGRFERLTLSHWSAASIAEEFRVKPDAAADLVVRRGSYPGAMRFRADVPRWTAYVRDSILEPAIGRDILALAAVRKPALLRQVFTLAASSPAQILSLQKMQGGLQDPGALETIAHYLALLEEAYLVATLPKFAMTKVRQRAAPPKLVTLNNALLAAVDPRGAPEPDSDPARFGTWVENACLAHAWNAGQEISYWREEPYEVDAVLDGGWGPWALEVKTGPFTTRDLAGLLEFTSRHPRFRPLVACDAESVATAHRAGAHALRWRDFLLRGPAAAAPPTE